MKTNMYRLSIITLAFISFIIGCQKESMTLTTKTLEKKSSSPMITPSKTHGMLAFDTWNDFSGIVNLLNERGIGFILDWSKEIDFRSQEVIYQEIIKEENAIADALLAKFDPDLTYEELRRIKPPHSSVYKEYLEKGLIQEILEDDGTTSFWHNAFNPTYMCVLNEDGLVSINDTIYQYSKNVVKYIPDGDFQKIERLKELNDTSEEENIIVVHYNKRTKLTGGDWSQSTGWISSGTLKRIMVTVNAQCPSSGQPETAALVSFYLEASAQGWWPFSWQFRNDYMPIDATQGSWDWSERYVEESNWFNDYTYYYSGNHYYTNYPWSGYTNYCKWNLDPDGWVGYCSGYLLDAFDIDYSFTVTFNVVGNVSLSN